MPEETANRASERDAPAADFEPMVWCPVCSRRLEQKKCKLFCPECGYFMSCADYY
ncbi:MAG: hypothetical protein KatS3mg004_2659 [Bryobacteraceae bacterium]|nr:MAG: hypothetical protein KatS3mg004_2659 [Bryobacteraceae bacterium]